MCRLWEVWLFCVLKSWVVTGCPLTFSYAGDSPPQTPSPPILPPFPCGAVPPCANDPTFTVGSLTCDEITSNLCGTNVFASPCGLSCLTCPICEDPDPIPGFEAILQFAEVEPGNLIIYIDLTQDLVSLEGVIGCLSAGCKQSLKVVLALLIERNVLQLTFVKSTVAGELIQVNITEAVLVTGLVISNAGYTGTIFTANGQEIFQILGITSMVV